MMRACLVTVALGLAGICWNVEPARSETLRTALVISNAQYANMPALARCTASAAVVRVALRGKGFEVVERSDLRRGEFDAAIGALAKRTAASAPSVAVVYYCGYAQEFNVNLDSALTEPVIRAPARRQTRARGGGINPFLLILILFAAGVWIVLQPMQMRGTLSVAG